MSKRIVFLSNHIWHSKRRAGFHALAQSFAEAGWEVLFVSTGLSLLSFLRKDRRLDSVERSEFNEIRQVDRNIYSYIYIPLLHPVRVPAYVGRPLQSALFSSYGKSVGPGFERFARSASIFVVESNSSIFLVDHIREKFPQGKLVYRVSDDVRVLPMSDLIREKEDDVISSFDLISVPSRIMLERFSAHPKALFHPHGIDQNFFNTDFPNPFPSRNSKNIVSVGSTLFDYDFVNTAARLRPSCLFHIVGDVSQKRLSAAKNIICYGELPFKEAACFSAHGDVALAPYILKSGAEYLAETSNKIGQYCYLRKAVVAPRFIVKRLGYKNMVPYDMDDEQSISSAIDTALDLRLCGAEVPRPPSWAEVRDELIRSVMSADAPQRLQA
jgi:2-beta-glucuronyltransferase